MTVNRLKLAMPGYDFFPSRFWNFRRDRQVGVPKVSTRAFFRKPDVGEIRLSGSTRESGSRQQRRPISYSTELLFSRSVARLSVRVLAGLLYGVEVMDVPTLVGWDVRPFLSRWQPA